MSTRLGRNFIFAGKTVFSLEKTEPDENQLERRKVPSANAEVFQDFLKFIHIQAFHSKIIMPNINKFLNKIYLPFLQCDTQSLHESFQIFNTVYVAWGTLYTSHNIKHHLPDTTVNHFVAQTLEILEPSKMCRF